MAEAKTKPTATSPQEFLAGIDPTSKRDDALGKTGESCAVGFSPRKQNLTLYLTGGFERFAEELERLGPNTTSKGSCLYLKQLAGIDLGVLEAMVRDSFERRNGVHLTR